MRIGADASNGLACGLGIPIALGAKEGENLQTMHMLSTQLYTEIASSHQPIRLAKESQESVTNSSFGWLCFIVLNDTTCSMPFRHRYKWSRYVSHPCVFGELLDTWPRNLQANPLKI